MYVANTNKMIYIYTHIYTYIHIYIYIYLFACRFSANHYYGMFHQVCDGTFSDTTFNHNNKAHNINIPTNGLIEEIEIPARSADNIRWYIHKNYVRILTPPTIHPDSAHLPSCPAHIMKHLFICMWFNKDMKLLTSFIFLFSTFENTCLIFRITTII